MLTIGGSSSAPAPLDSAHLCHVACAIDVRAPTCAQLLACADAIQAASARLGSAGKPIRERLAASDSADALFTVVSAAVLVALARRHSWSPAHAWLFALQPAHCAAFPFLGGHASAALCLRESLVLALRAVFFVPAVNPLVVRQVFDSVSSTYSYLVFDAVTRDAALIDSVRERHARDVALIAQLCLRLRWAIDTHVHADHVTNSGELRRMDGSGAAAKGCPVVVHEACKIVLSAQAGAPADVLLADGDVLQIGTRRLHARATPGHTDGCMALLVDDCSAIFTGDVLLVRGCGRTDFQQGSAASLYRSIHTKVYVLPDSTVIYPGHDYDGHLQSTVGEERAHNPDLGATVSEASFVDMMGSLQLKRPALIDVAVPLNLRNGLAE